MNLKRQKEEQLLASCQLIIFCRENITFGELLEFSQIVMDAQHPVVPLFLEGRKMQTMFYEYMVTEDGKTFAALFGSTISRFDAFNDLVTLNHTMIGRSREIHEKEPLWEAWVKMREIIATYTMLRIDIDVIKKFVDDLLRSRPLIAHGNIVECIGKNMKDIESVSAWDNIISLAHAVRMLLIEKQKMLASLPEKDKQINE